MKEPLDGNDCCVYMHTALRKVCESKATSALYNAVTVICDAKPSKLNAWRIFGEVIATSLQDGVAGKLDVTPAMAVARPWLIKRFDTLFHDVRCKEHYDKTGTRDLPEKVRAHFYLLKCMLELLDKDDWEGMLSYLTEDGGE